MHETKKKIEKYETLKFIISSVFYFLLIIFVIYMMIMIMSDSFSWDDQFILISIVSMIILVVFTFLSKIIENQYRITLKQDVLDDKLNNVLSEMKKLGTTNEW